MNYSGYHQTFRVYPFAFFTKPELEYQGKTKLNLEYPLMFELTNHKNPSRKVHCGVLEFLAEEGKVYIPFWMMQNIGLEPGAFMKVSTVSLPRGNFVKIQPQSTAFLDISNPKAVLEMTFRNFSALTVGETILIKYNNKDYHVSVLEVRPNHPTNGISIIETDMEVDFAPPIGYVEPTPVNKSVDKGKAPATQQPTPSNGSLTFAAPTAKSTTQQSTEDEEEEDDKPTFKAFTGAGYVLSKKGTNTATSSNTNNPTPSNTGNKISFGSKPSNKRKEESDEDDEEEEDTKPKFVAFSGTGYSLK